MSNSKVPLLSGDTVDTPFGPGVVEGSYSNRRVVLFVGYAPDLGASGTQFHAVRFPDHHRWIETSILHRRN